MTHDEERSDEPIEARSDAEAGPKCIVCKQDIATHSSPSDHPVISRVYDPAVWPDVTELHLTHERHLRWLAGENLFDLFEEQCDE